MKIKIFFFLLIISLSLNAQQTNFYTQKFGEQSGLITGSIINMGKDSEGFIWIIGLSYIQRYDGTSFKDIDLSTAQHSNILSFFETYKGEKFVIDVDGLIYFIESDTLRAYSYNHLLKNLNERNRYQDVYFDIHDQLHISYAGSGYCIVDSTGEISFPLREKKIFGFACILKSNGLPFIAMEFNKNNDVNNILHYYLFDEKLNLIDKKKMEALEYRYQPGITQKPSGGYLFSSGFGNILEFDTNRIIREIIYEEPILRLLIDRDTGLWVSSPKQIQYYDNLDIENTKPITFNDGTFSIAGEQDFEGGIWIFNNKQVEYIPNINHKLLQKEGKLVHNNDIQAIESINDTLWVSTFAGEKLSLIDKNHSYLDSLILPPMVFSKKQAEGFNFINDIYYDKKNTNIWLTRRGGIFYLKDQKWFELSLKNIARTNTGTIYLFSDQPYESSYSMGIYFGNQFLLLKNDTIDFVSQKFPKRITETLIVRDSIYINTIDGNYLQVGDSIIDLGERYPELKNKVYQMIYFDQKVWFATLQRGLYFLEKNKLKEIKYKNISINRARLISNNPNELWILSKQACFLYNSEKNKTNSQSIKLTAYNQYNLSGRKKSETYKELLYIGHRNDGIRVIDLEKLKKDTLFPPRMYINQLKIDGIERKPSDLTFQLKYDQSFIQVYYIGLSYSKLKINYRHRMIGLNDKWTNTKETYIQFTTLPPGNYTFEIQCRRGEQTWSNSKYLTFSISPPFWKTWWFISISFLFILIATILIINYRLKIIQKEKNLLVDRLKAEQKALRAQMSPHFIFNIIASIRYTINKESTEKANTFLDMFSNSMRNILNQSNENHITIHNEIKFLTEYIEMERFRLEDSFNYEIENSEISDDYLEKLIPPFIIQPFVENAIQHGLKNKEENGFLKLNFRMSHSFLQVSIEDNGIGREKANQYRKTKKDNSDKSHGLRIIKERLELYNEKKSNVSIEDLYDEMNNSIGTRVIVDIRIMDKLNEK